MLPKYHVVLGLIFSAFLLFLFPQIGWLGFTIIFLSSVLIDVDHYLFHVYTKKDFNLKNAYNWFIERVLEFKKIPRHIRRKKIKPIPCVFHGIEVIILLILLSFFSKIFLYILIGFAFHQFLDIINDIYHGFPFYHMTFQTLNVLRYRKSK